MLLPGRIAGQHNSVKLQYSLTFNFLCMFSHARRVRAHPKEAAFLLSKNMFMQTRCRNSPGIQGCKSYFTSLSGRERYGFPPCVKTLALHTRVFMFIHRISSSCSFLDAWNWQQFAAGSCKFATHSSLFHMSIMANTLAAKKQFGTRKWWVWARRGCTRVFYTIPSFRIDHSQITQLFIVNTCHLTSCLWYRPYIIYQLACTDWNIIGLPAWGTAVIQHLDLVSGQSPPALAENNSINSFFNFFHLCRSFC